MAGPSITHTVVRSDASSPHHPPLVDEDELQLMSPELQRLHNAYLQSPCEANSFTVEMPAGWFHDFDTYITTSWDDIKDVLTLDELDVSIIQVWTM